MRTYELYRVVDESGVSGTGVVAQGVEFDDGTCALRWLTEHRSSAFYASIRDVELIHGHGGKTKIVFTGDAARAMTTPSHLEDLRPAEEVAREMFPMRTMGYSRILFCYNGHKLPLADWSRRADPYVDYEQFIDAVGRIINGEHKAAFEAGVNSVWAKLRTMPPADAGGQI